MSGWTNIKIRVEEGTEDTATASPRSNTEIVEDYFARKDNFNEIGKLEYQATERHWGFDSRYGGGDSFSAVEDIFDDLPMITHLALTYANDTSDSGTAYMFKRTSDGVEKVFEYQGAERARGHDATEAVADEYGFAATASPYW